MRVLTISNLYPPDIIGGYEMRCMDAVGSLRRRGHDVQVMTSAPRVPIEPTPGVSRIFRMADIYDFHSPPSATASRRRLIDVESAFLSSGNVYQLALGVEEYRPDVAYLFNLVGLGGLAIVATLDQMGVPWVWHLFDAVPRMLCSLNDDVVPAVAASFGRFFEGSYLAVSQRVFDEVEAGGVELRGTCEVVPNWVTVTPQEPERKYFSGGHLAIVAAGQVAQHKGVDLLIEAAAQLQGAGYANFSIDIFGHNDNPYFPGLVHRYELGERVSFKGFLPAGELEKQFSRYDIFALPTWEREPFATAPLEAGAYGCVPLMTADCGNSEWFVHGVDCIKVARNAASIAGAIRGVLDGNVDMAAIGRRAASTIRRDFHLDRVTDRIEQVLMQASTPTTDPRWTALEVYRLATLAEKVLSVEMYARC